MSTDQQKEASGWLTSEDIAALAEAFERDKRNYYETKEREQRLANHRLIRRKVSWFCDSFLISVIIGMVLVSLLNITAQVRQTREVLPFAGLMTLALTNVIYRLKEPKN